MDTEFPMSQSNRQFKKGYRHRLGGFTLIEILVVISITVLLATFVGITYSVMTRKNILEQETGKVVSLLEEARTFSLASKNLLSHGVHFDDQSVVAFSGAGYVAGTPGNRAFPIDSRISLDATLEGSAVDIIFDRMSGATLASGRIDLSVVSNPDERNTITVYKTGITEIASNLPALEFELTLEKGGDGTGTIETEGELALIPASSMLAAAGGLSKKLPKMVCASDCQTAKRTFAKKSAVTLTAVPDPNSVFDGWTGGCTGTAPLCNLTIRKNETVIATFSKKPVLYELRIVKTGNSKGTITGSEAGISCGNTCLDVKYKYLEGSSVILSADPAANSKIAWGGQCLSAGSNPTCAVNMDSDKTVFANFSKIPQRTLRVKVDNFTRNAGFLKRTPGTMYSFGLRTQSTTEASYPEGTKVVLMRYPSNSTEEINWSGACSGSSNTCEVTMDTDKYVVLRLNDAPPKNLFIFVVYFNKSSGALYTSPWGVYYYGPNASNKPNGLFPYGTKVQLIPDPYGTSRVMFWGGACSGSGSACEVTMNQNQFVLLLFTK